MNIAFKPLGEADFKLLKWLEEPHVKDWWDKDIIKSINAYIIYIDEIPIGYIQLYNAYDFSRSVSLTGLPSSLAAFDVFIGEKQFLNQGIGLKSIDQFLNEYASSYAYVFADPEITNGAAIRSYEKAGFKKTIAQPDSNEVWLLRENFLKTRQNLM